MSSSDSWSGANPPARIGRYEIVRELGRGMMGVVFEARDPALGRRIALKTIQLAFSVSPAEREGFEKRFFAEARVAAGLSHPGILVVHDVGRDPDTGLLFIALEYLEGRTLADALAGGVPLDWHEALRIVRGVANALAHAHAAGVVHRDIKPANIMLLPTGETKIMDFGIAKLEAAGGGLTSTGQFFGTPVYMAPEQALGQKVDGRADLFSLGATAYALLTGQLAFAADNVVAIIGRVTRHDPTPPSQVVRGIPADVDYIVSRALAKDPADRYPDGRTMAEDIDDVLGGRTPRHRRTWTPPRRADGTMVSMLADLPAQAVAMPAPSVPLLTGSNTSTSRPAVPAPQPAMPPSAPRRGGRVAAAPNRAWVRLVAAALAGGAVAAFVVLRTISSSPGPEPPAPEHPAGTVEPARSTEPPSEAVPTPQPESPPATAATEETATPVPTREKRPAAAAAVGSARLAVDFEHPLKNGTLRVWVDDVLVLDEKLASKAKKIVAVTVRKGSVREVVPIAAGDHDVRVEVAWDDQRRTGALWGHVEPDETRTLEIRMPPVLKTLMMQWK